MSRLQRAKKGKDWKKMNTPKIPPPNPADLDDVICIKCGSTIFSTGIRLKRVSAIQSRTKNETVWIQYIAYCTRCKEPDPTIPMPATKQVAFSNVDPEDLEVMKCKDCESTLFRSATLVKRVSALQSQTGKATVATQALAVCVQCYEPIINLIK